ncbi:two-component system response regulator YesN [Paenibacillus turicensis]|uniref:Two-component system response regulator YesN n=1 Tax=Paenibacillus turicensis TaxID=160487 RepID=A0ABS4FV70_9BACL|nr:response regulator [Paenibacillus turicensis]MBP1906429.1 two-component system response regulator YesN [Paenibacillus turicensis]
MLRIVIVDDEVLIREGLAKMIQKENPTFHIVGLFADGQDVLEALPNLGVDVVITDIRMPMLGGLPLIKELQNHYPHIRSILMSGYVDFGYAQEAIRCSAVDYLLKPINKEQLFELLYRLQQEQQTKLNQVKEQRILLLSALLSQEENKDKQIVGVPFPHSFFVPFILKSNEARHLQYCASRLQQLQVQLTNCTSQSELVMGIELDLLWRDQAYQGWIIYFTQPPSPEQLDGIGRQLLAYAEQESFPLHIGSGGLCVNLTQLQSAFNIARYTCDQGLYSNRIHYFSHSLSPPCLTKIKKRQPEAYPQLINDLKILNTTSLQHWLIQNFTNIKEQQGGLSHIYDLCCLISSKIEHEVDEWTTFFHDQILQQLQSDLYLFFRYDELVSYVVDIFLSKLELIRADRLASLASATLTIKQYIHEHYAEQIDLNALAAIVYLTPTYVSKLFKQETGHTITDYLTDVRLQHAKRLLTQQPHLKVQEISEQVGYADVAYFHKLFKRTIGITPSQFKKITHSTIQA